MQLRDARTGELVYEGEPVECVLTVKALGRPAGVVGPGDALPADVELLYDAPASFDADAVLEQHYARLESLKAAQAELKGERDPDEAQRAHADRVDEAVAEVAGLEAQAAVDAPNVDNEVDLARRRADEARQQADDA